MAVSVTAVLKVMITESMSASLLLMIVRGANFPLIMGRPNHDSQPVCTSSLPLTNPFDGVPLCIFKPVSESVVKNLILQSATKICQLDLIPTSLLVECLDTLLPSLTALVNSSLSSCVFPEVFKTALVTPLLKKKIS